MTTVLQEGRGRWPLAKGGRQTRATANRLGEWLWGLLTLGLFMLLGPFSAPVVVIALVKLGLQDNQSPEPELLRPMEPTAPPSGQRR